MTVSNCIPPLALLVKNHGRIMRAWITLFLAVPKCARNPTHSSRKIARDCQANEDDTVAKQSNLLTFS